MRFIKLSKSVFPTKNDVKSYFKEELFGENKGVFYVIGKKRMKDYLDPDEELLWFYEDRLVAIGKSKGELITGEELEKSLEGYQLNTKEAFRVAWFQYIEGLVDISLRDIEKVADKVLLFTFYGPWEEYSKVTAVSQIGGTKWGVLRANPTKDMVWQAILKKINEEVGIEL